MTEPLKQDDKKEDPKPQVSAEVRERAKRNKERAQANKISLASYQDNAEAVGRRLASPDMGLSEIMEKQEEERAALEGAEEVEEKE